MKHDSKDNNKNTAKKVISLGAALSVIAGIGATTLNNPQEAQAKRVSSKTSIINKSKDNKDEKKTSSTKRPSSNIEKTSGKINLRNESRGGRRPSSSPENKRKAVTKVVNKTDNDSANETNTENTSKRPNKKYSSVDEKKQKSKSLVKNSNTSSSTNSESSSNRIVIKVSTKK